MFNQDEGKIECAVGNREICVWQGKKAEFVLILFLTSGFAVFICLWGLKTGSKSAVTAATAGGSNRAPLFINPLVITYLSTKFGENRSTFHFLAKLRPYKYYV